MDDELQPKANVSEVVRQLLARSVQHEIQHMSRDDRQRMYRDSCANADLVAAIRKSLEHTQEQ